ncbi:MAG TPA: hypothetical protein VMT99_02695 [Candidatus Paceibacterota bacterium]|nr:hypothetical protein [Candidatus Paceibacterota bacterium]
MTTELFRLALEFRGLSDEDSDDTGVDDIEELDGEEEGAEELGVEEEADPLIEG